MIKELIAFKVQENWVFVDFNFRCFFQISKPFIIKHIQTQRAIMVHT